MNLINPSRGFSVMATCLCGVLYFAPSLVALMWASETMVEVEAVVVFAAVLVAFWCFCLSALVNAIFGLRWDCAALRNPRIGSGTRQSNSRHPLSGWPVESSSLILKPGKFRDCVWSLLTEKTPLATTTTTYTYDVRNRRPTAKDPLNNTATYAYHGRSLLSSMTDPLNRVTTFGYDAVGRRTKMTQPPSAPGGAAIVAEFNHYLTKDHLGSTTALVSASTNAVVERYTYDEYGAVQVWNTSNQPVSSTPLTRTLFTGREHEPATGLYHYRHRWYHPGIGRFTSPDPIGFEGGDVNWYGYVSSQPTKWVDPAGLWTVSPRLNISIGCINLNFALNMGSGGVNFTASAGLGLTLGASATGGITVTNASPVDALRGVSLCAGASVGAQGAVAEANYVTGTDSHVPPTYPYGPYFPTPPSIMV